MTQAICWTLIHSLWQGVLLAICAGLVILCTGRSAPAVRYRWFGGLSILFLFGLAATLCYECSAATGTGGGGWTDAGWLAGYCNAHASLVVGGWLAVAAIRSLRLGFGWHYMRRIKLESTMATGSWPDRIEVLSRQLGMRRVVKVVESGMARVPMVVGQLRPFIVVPLGLINQLPASEMEAILLHELAHIRRNDHLVNCIQQIAECFLFFNPGFLWVSALLREERENCCDEVAIVQTGDKVSLVRALVRFSEYSQGALALAFPGSRRQLLHRVIRISRDHNKPLNTGQRVFLSAGLLGLLWLLSFGTGKSDTKQSKVQTRDKTAQGSADLSAVLQSRERVTENMEWVEAQLKTLRRKKMKSAVAAGNPDVSRSAKERYEAAPNRNNVVPDGVLQPLTGEQARQLRQANLALADESRVLQTRFQDLLAAEQELDVRHEALRSLQESQHAGQQALLNREAAEADRRRAQQETELAGQNRLEAERIRERDELARRQAQQDRQQTERNREEAARNRLKIDQDRIQAEQDMVQAEAGRRRMLSDRERALRDQREAIRNRQLALREQQAEDAGSRQDKPHS